MSLGAWRFFLKDRSIVSPTRLRRDAEHVARDLLGVHLVSVVGGEVTEGRIVETEAYVGPHDPACHAAAGRTARTAPMYAAAGIAYVYFVYGMHWCFNVVTGAAGNAQAVLIRGLEPVAGRSIMVRRRRRERDLTAGPARLCEALGIDGSLNQHPLTDPPLLLIEGGLGRDERVGVSGRIGVRKAQDWPLRFFIEGHPDISPHRPPPVDRNRPVR